MELKTLPVWNKLAQCNLTDADLIGLKEPQSLNKLYIHYNTKVTDTGMKELKELENSTTLVLSGTQVVDAGITELR